MLQLRLQADFRQDLGFTCPQCSQKQPATVWIENVKASSYPIFLGGKFGQNLFSCFLVVWVWNHRSLGTNAKQILFLLMQKKKKVSLSAQRHWTARLPPLGRRSLASSQSELPALLFKLLHHVQLPSFPPYDLAQLSCTDWVPGLLSLCRDCKISHLLGKYPGPDSPLVYTIFCFFCFY